jgi:hypothetical protein
MRRILATAAFVAAAVIPATVLASSAGSAASVASRTSSQATTLSWHPLTLSNGWQSFPSTSHYGAPAWAVSAGIVYLRGLAHGGAGADFATLPRRARPAHILWITYVTSGPTTSGLRVEPNGLISLFGPGDAVTLSSLDGVSFPIKA